MKKQVKVIIGVVVAIAILIAGISLFYPSVFKGLTSGTFGKADKYHKTQMTEKDIQLRSEFTKDTAQLKSMIQGLIYFSLFTRDLSNNIDSCVNSFQKQGMTSQSKGYANVLVLQDYSGFIKNNNKTLGTTISMLTGFYLNDQADQSVDVEKNIHDFGNYVTNLSEKDSVLEMALKSMDNFMLSDKTMKTKKAELSSLKSIRDQLLLQSVQLGGMLQDKPLCAQLLSYALSSQSALNIIILGKEQMSFIAPAARLNVIMNQDKLENIIGSKDVAFGSNLQLGNIIQAQQLGKDVNNSKQGLGNLVGSVMVYDKDNLQFFIGNKGELQKFFGSSPQITALLQGSATLGRLAGVAVFSSEGLNLYQLKIELMPVYSSQQNNLGMTLSSAQLNQILSNQQGPGAIPYSSNFINMMDRLGSMGLGVRIDP